MKVKFCESLIAQGELLAFPQLEMATLVKVLLARRLMLAGATFVNFTSRKV